MDELRLKRYQDKINYVISSFKLLPTEPKNELEKRGIFYTLQTVIESVVDLVAMAIKDSGIPVSDDENNILELVKIRKLKPELGEDLKKANGMRNFLVHRYNNVDEEIILNSVKKIKKLLLEWIQIIEDIKVDHTNNSGN